MQEYLVCLIPKYSAQNITSNLAIYFWNIADYFGILVILQAIFKRILIGIGLIGLYAAFNAVLELKLYNQKRPFLPRDNVIFRRVKAQN